MKNIPRLASPTLLAALLAISLVGTAAAQSKNYAVKDLEALASQKNWPELLEHIDDIAPSERNAAWNKLLEKASLGYIHTLSENDQVYQGYAVFKQLLGRFPDLKSSKPFMKKRNEIGLKALAGCFRNSYRVAECIKEVDIFIKADKANTKLAFEAAKIIRMNSSMAPTKLFAFALSDTKMRKSWCKDDQVEVATRKGLSSKPTGEAATNARKIAFDMCWSELEPMVMKEFQAQAVSTYADYNICSGLKKRKKLNKFAAAYCTDRLAK